VTDTPAPPPTETSTPIPEPPTSTPEPTATPTLAPTPTPTATPPVALRVTDLDGIGTADGKGWQATVTITILDANQSQVANATLSGAWAGDVTGQTSCATNSSGQCQLQSDKLGKQTAQVTFTVNNVSHAALTYQATANTDPDGDSNGTTITISKPN
jgi:hypothetical protein